MVCVYNVRVERLFCIRMRTREEIYGQIYPKGGIFDQISRVESSYGQYIILTIIRLIITSLISLAISLYTPYRVFSEIYPLLEGNTEVLNLNIPLLRMIYCQVFFIFFDYIPC